MQCLTLMSLSDIGGWLGGIGGSLPFRRPDKLVHPSMSSHASLIGFHHTEARACFREPYEPKRESTRQFLQQFETDQSSRLAALMPHQRINPIWLVVHTEAIHQRSRRPSHADHVNHGTSLAQFQHDLVQSGHCCDVPEMRATQVDGQCFKFFLEIEGVGEAICRAEEHLPGDVVVR